MPTWSGTVLPFGAILFAPLAGLWMTRLMAERGQAGERELPVHSNVLLVVFGQLALLLALWWQLYRPEFHLLDPLWVRELAFDLTQGGVRAVASWLGAATMTFLWIVGITDSLRPLTHDRIWAAMRRGCFAFGALAVILAIFGGHESVVMVGPVVAFFCVSLVALAFTGLKTAVSLSVPLGSRAQRSALRFRVGGHWLTTVGLVVAAILGVGFIGLLVLEPETIAMVRRGVVLAFRAAVYGLLVAGGFLQGVMLRVLGKDATEPPQRPGWVEQRPGDADTPQRPMDFEVPEPGETFALGVVLGSLLILVVVGVAAMFLLRLTRPRKMFGESRESVESAEIVWASFRSFLHGLRPRWRLRKTRLDPFLSLDGEVRGRLAVRSTYQRFLAEMKSRGWSRPRAATPEVYQRSLRGTLGAGVGTVDEVTMDLEALTRVYQRVRYGGEDPAPEQVNAAVAAWGRLRERTAGQASEDGRPRESLDA